MSLQGDGILENAGIVQGASHLLYEAGQLVNTGEVSSSQTVDIRRDFANRGTIGSSGTLALYGTDLSSSSGRLCGDKGIAATFKAFNNTGALSSAEGDVTVTLEEGENAGSMGAAEELTLTIGTKFENSRGPGLKGDKITLKGDGALENSGKVRAISSLITQGQGRLENHGDILSQGSIRIANPFLLNTKIIQADGEFHLTGARVKNDPEAMLLSNTYLETSPQTLLTNQGTVSSGGTLIIGQDSYTNQGTVKAQGTLSLPTCQTLENQEGALLLSEEGLVSLPRLTTLDNAGVLESHASLDFSGLRSYRNRGTISSADFLNLTFPEDLRNEGSLFGKRGVRIMVEGHDFDHSGTIVSENTVDVRARHIINRQDIQGIQGISLIAAETLTHEEEARLSSQEAVSLEAQTVQPLGEIQGQSLEISNNGTPFVDAGLPRFTTDSLILHIPQGWDLHGAPRTFRYNITLNGPLFNPSTLASERDLTWNLDPSGTTSSLSNSFDITARGVLTLTMNGPWTNLGRVIGNAGATIATSHFTNRGSFWGARHTDFTCPHGLDNYGWLHLHGGAIFRLGSSFINYPAGEVKQRVLPDTENIVHLTAGQDIRNISGYVAIEGGLDAKAQVFSNELEDLPPHVILPPPPENTDGEVMCQGWLISFSEYQDVARITRDTLPQRAVFYAGSARIEANSLQTIGSTFSARQAIYFKGELCRNERIIYKETGKIGKLQYSSSKGGWGFFKTKDSGSWLEWVPYTREIATHPAQIYSQGDINLLVKGQPFTKAFPYTPGTLENTGDIRGEMVTLEAANFDNMGAPQAHVFQSALPPTIPLFSNFDRRHLEGPSFVTMDTTGETGAYFTSLIPVPPLSAHSFQEQLGGTANYDSSREEALERLVQRYRAHFAMLWAVRTQGFLPTNSQSSAIQGLETRDEYAPVEGVIMTRLPSYTAADAHWEPQDADSLALELPEMALSLSRPPSRVPSGFSPFVDPRGLTHYPHITVTSLSMIPACCAVLEDPRYKPGVPYRMHFGPLLAAELLHKTLLNTIGFGTVYNRIHTPELLYHVLVAEGYFNGRQVHGLPPAPVPSNWEQLSYREKLTHQLHEIVKWAELGQFKGPAIVYQLMEEHGELVLSDVLYLPQELRERLVASYGRVRANFIGIQTTQTCRNQQGLLEADKALVARSTGTFENYSGTVQAGTIFVETDSYANATLPSYPFRQAAMRARRGDIGIYARQEARRVGAIEEATGNITSVCDGPDFMGVQQVASSSTSRQGKTTTTTYTSTPLRTEMTAGENVRSFSAGPKETAGVKVRGGQAVQLVSASTMGARGTQAVRRTESTTTTKKGFLRGTFQQTTHTTSSTFVPDEVEAGTEVSLIAMGDTVQQAPIVTSRGTVDIHSLQGRLDFPVGMSDTTFQQQTQSSNLIFQHRRDQGYREQTAALAHISAPGGVFLSGAQGGTVEIPERASLEELQQQSGREWIETLRRDPSVQFHPVREVCDNWDYSSRTLTPAMVALLSLPLAMATSGAGTFLMASLAEALAIGAKTATLLATVSDALITSLAVQGGTSLIGNGGDLSETFKGLVSSQSLQSLLLTTTTAGFTEGLAEQLKALPQGLRKTAVQAGVSTAFTALTNPGNVGQSALQGLTTAVSTASAAKVANWIGALYHPSPVVKGGVTLQPESTITWTEHKLLHLGLGVMLGAGTNWKNAGAAGLGGGFAAFGAECIAEGLPGTLSLETRGNIAKLGSTFLTFLLTGDASAVNAAAHASTNAIENNFGLNPSADAEIERKKQEAYAKAGETSLTEIEDIVAYRDEKVAQVASQIGEIDYALHQPGLSKAAKGALLEERDHLIGALDHAAALSVTPLGIGIEAASLAMMAGPGIKGLTQVGKTAARASAQAFTAKRAAVQTLHVSGLSARLASAESGSLRAMAALRTESVAAEGGGHLFPRKGVQATRGDLPTIGEGKSSVLNPMGPRHPTEAWYKPPRTTSRSNAAEAGCEVARLKALKGERAAKIEVAHPRAPRHGIAMAEAAEESRSQAMAALYGEISLQPPLLTKATRTPNAAGHISSFVTTRDEIYYRVYSDNPQGRFLTKIPPKSRKLANEGLALPPENEATYVQEVLVNAGTRLQRSRVLPAYNKRGGMEQFELLDKIPRVNFKEGKPL